MLDFYSCFTSNYVLGKNRQKFHHKHKIKNHKKRLKHKNNVYLALFGVPLGVMHGQYQSLLKVPPKIHVRSKNTKFRKPFEVLEVFLGFFQ